MNLNCRTAFAAFFALCCAAHAAERVLMPFEDGWSSVMTPEKGSPRRLDGLSLPHNWEDYHGMRGFVHGNLHGSAVYNRTFTAAGLEGRRSFLVFDGAGSYLSVRLNGRELCRRRPAGRLVTTVETTGVARDGENVLEVVCDHPSEIQDMPWHCGGCSGIGSEGPEPFGLFRGVRFEVTDEIRIAPFGVHIWHDAAVSNVFVETEVTAGSRAGVRRLRIVCPELGIDAAADLSVPASGAVTNRMTFALKDVTRWSPANPRLYTFRVSVGDDRESVRTGFATHQWPVPPAPKKPDGSPEHRYLINGEPFFIHGTCETDNRFGASVAFEPEEIDARCAEVKRLGFNAWRDGHEPHDLRYNRYWDENGIIWWPQLSTHTFFDTPEFKRNFLAAIEQWMKERRNSPSIALWGLQNESVLDEEFARECTALIHRLDPMAGRGGRVVTTCNYGCGADWNVIQNWSGCYAGEVGEYQASLTKPYQLLNGEYGAWRSVGFHSDPDRAYEKSEPWTEEHNAHVLWQKILRAWDVRNHVCGHFLWTFFTHENPGRVVIDEGHKLIEKIGPLNPKGLYTIYGRRSVAWYVYLAYGKFLREGTLGRYRYRPLSWWIETGRKMTEPPQAELFVPSSAPGAVYLHRLNCGGDATVDSLGNRWSADTTAYSRSWAQAADLQAPGLALDPVLASRDEVVGAVVNAAAADRSVFGTYRFGRHRLSFGFSAPPGAPCTVELYFVEPGSYGRIFDVALNGKVVEKNFDLGGFPERTVVRREYKVTASADGRIVLTFPRVAVNQAVVSAIAVRTSPETAAGWTPAAAEGYPLSAGLTWRELAAKTRDETPREMLPEGEKARLAPVTPLQPLPKDRHGMKCAGFLLRVASRYSVTMMVRKGNVKGRRLRWRLENSAGTACIVSGEFVMPEPDAEARFSVPLGMEVNAGYYVFCYDAGEDIELSAREMK